MSGPFRMTFYGTRGSRTAAGPAFVRWGGHTTCIGVRVGERQLILDAGSGLVHLGEQQVAQHFASGTTGPLRSWIFQTHTHLDHICGLPYYIPFYLPFSTTWFFGPPNPFMSFETTIRRFLSPPYHPVPPEEMPGRIHWRELTPPRSVLFLRDQDEPLILSLKHPDDRAIAPPPEQVEIAVHTMHGYNHPKCGVSIYRIEYAGRALVFATDVEGYVLGDQRLIAFAQGADALIHDAMFTSERYANPRAPTQGWGHSTAEIAAEVALRAGVRHLYLVHHDPALSDDALLELEAQARAVFPHTTSARDGMEVDLHALAAP